MLDDLKYIHEKDQADALGTVGRQWQQLEVEFGVGAHDGFRPLNVVFAGMGGSALAGLVAQSWPGSLVPFEVVRQYDLPAYVGEQTLVVASSYSGNTEETLSLLAQAEQLGAKIVVIASGGQLAEIAESKGYPLAKLPEVNQPRYAVLASLKATLQLLAPYGLWADADWRARLDGTVDLLKETADQWRADVATKQNPAKQLAQELMGLSAVVYAGPKLWPAAYKWKIDFNENAKHVAWAGQLPEFNHNEFIGWSQQPIDKPYGVVDLRSGLEHDRVQQRFAVSERLLSGRRPQPHVVEARGDNLLQQLAWTIMLGDFVTIYLALLSGINPAPVDLVEKFKKELDK